MKAAACTASGVVLLALVMPAEAQFGGQSTNISGRWTGGWYNSNGSSGGDSLDVIEYRNGRISGVWGDGYYIRGQQTDPRSYFWESFSEGYHYRAWARVSRDGDRMRVRYLVTYREHGRRQQYGGWSRLWRRADYGYGRRNRDYGDRYPSFDNRYPGFGGPNYGYGGRYF